MTKDEYEDFALRYKGCGACFPMYHTLSRFEKIWFTAIQKDVAELEAQIEKMKCCGNCKYRDDMTSYCKKHKKEIYIFMVDSKCNDWKLFD